MRNLKIFQSDHKQGFSSGARQRVGAHISADVEKNCLWLQLIKVNVGGDCAYNDLVNIENRENRENVMKLQQFGPN